MQDELYQYIQKHSGKVGGGGGRGSLDPNLKRQNMQVRDSSRMGSLDSSDRDNKNHLKLDLSKLGAQTDGSGEELEVAKPEPVVVKETKIISNVRHVHKHDKKTFRFVQDLVLTFMHEGQNQYMKQAERWQELYEEQA